MPHWLEWLLGIKSPPDWVRGPDSRWQVEFRSLPEGNAAALAIAAAVICMAGTWWLYRGEGRSLALTPRLLLSLLRLGVLLAVTFMLLEMVVVITKHEQVPSRLLVLMDTSQSMALADPYSNDAVARETAGRVGLQTPAGEPDIVKLRKLSRFDLAQKIAAETWHRSGPGTRDFAVWLRR